MIFSHTQISQYLRCPRSYRYRYLDGWREKETRAAMAFGRCFEKALTAYFGGEDCTAAYSRNGALSVTLLSNIKEENRGIVSFTRVSICSSVSHRMIASRFLIRSRICR
jgi:dTDP-4-amino-4,6-dideoxygalactose transaminase